MRKQSAYRSSKELEIGDGVAGGRKLSLVPLTQVDRGTPVYLRRGPVSHTVGNTPTYILIHLAPSAGLWGAE